MYAYGSGREAGEAVHIVRVMMFVCVPAPLQAVLHGGRWEPRVPG